jgi:hypothetical protein
MDWVIGILRQVNKLSDISSDDDDVYFLLDTHY